MIRDIFDYIFYRITHANKWWYNITDLSDILGIFNIKCEHTLGYEDYGCIHFSLLLTLNANAITCLFIDLTYSLIFVFSGLYLVTLLLLYRYAKGERRYKALAHKYRNEKYHKLKGYAALAYVILSFVLFFVVMLSK